MHEKADFFKARILRAHQLLKNQDDFHIEDYILEVNAAANDFDSTFRTVNLTCNMAMDFITSIGLYDEFVAFIEFLKSQSSDEKPALTRIK